MSFLDRALSKLFNTRLLLDIKKIRKNDIMVHIGGSLFMETRGPNFWYREKKFYKQIKIPYYIIGSNVGPIQTNEFVSILRKVFAGAKDVCFRDQASYDLFKDIPSVRVATDIAFTLDTSECSTAEQEKQVVFSIINAYKKFDEETAERYEQEVIKLAKKSIKDGYRVTFMSFCKFEGDEDAIKRIMGKMDNSLRQKINTYLYRGDLDEALAVLANSEIIVASRFHASILGLVFGKKILPLAYSDKTTNILNDMHFEGPVIDIRKIDEFDGSKFDFSTLKLNDVSAQKKLAEKQFQELDKVLTRRE